MKCWTKLKESDPDSLFSYNTVKIVRINDRRLGLLYYAFIAAVLGYVVGYTVIYQKRYLAIETPVGSVRMSLLKSTSPLGNHTYCAQNQPSVNNFTNFPCMYWDDSRVVYPFIEQTAMLAATRVTVQNYTLNCDFATDVNCDYTMLNNETFYVGDIENFTFMFDHTAYAIDLGIQSNAQYLTGTLYDVNDNPMQLSLPDQVGIYDALDIVRLKTMLQAAGIDSLDTSANTLNLKNTNESKRYAGIILLVIIQYTNANSFDTSIVEYSVKVRYVQNTEFKVEESRFSDEFSKLIVYNRHGIRMLILQSGHIGRFDFQTLLINVVSGFGLMAVATLLVDMIALYLLPEKEVYNLYKFDDTLDFSDIRDGIAAVEQDQILLSKKDKLAKIEYEPLLHSSRNSLVNGTSQNELRSSTLV